MQCVIKKYLLFAGESFFLKKKTIRTERIKWKKPSKSHLVAEKKGGKHIVKERVVICCKEWSFCIENGVSARANMTQQIETKKTKK